MCPNLLLLEGRNKVQRWEGTVNLVKKEKTVSAQSACGFYVPRHSDFILAANKERPLSVSMVTTNLNIDEVNKVAGKRIQFVVRLDIFCPFCGISILLIF